MEYITQIIYSLLQIKLPINIILISLIIIITRTVSLVLIRGVNMKKLMTSSILETTWVVCVNVISAKIIK